MPAVFSIVGRKGSGKSQVLEVLISLLRQKGYRVGVIKQLARDDFEIDQPEKDTYRYRQQGAETVMLAGRKRLALFSNLEEEVPLERLLETFHEFDLVFLEGYFQDELPKIEVYKQELGSPLLGEGTRNVFAVCSDTSFEALDRLAALIEEKL
jgi:molybdopterin-guanine dinucleotide biosynthesis protein MobB